MAFKELLSVTLQQGSRKCRLCSARWLPTDAMIEGNRLFRFPVFTKMSRDVTAEWELLKQNGCGSPQSSHCIMSAHEHQHTKCLVSFCSAD